MLLMNDAGCQRGVLLIISRRFSLPAKTMRRIYVPLVCPHPTLRGLRTRVIIRTHRCGKEWSVRRKNESNLMFHLTSRQKSASDSMFHLTSRRKSSSCVEFYVPPHNSSNNAAHSGTLLSYLQSTKRVLMLDVDDLPPSLSPLLSSGQQQQQQH